MTLIDKAEALRIVMEECYKDREMKLATRIEERIAALPARGVGVPGIDGWVRRLRKTEEAGHVHHLSKADRLAIADFLAALAPTDAAQAREAALKKAAQLAYEVWDDPEALAKAILALIGETRA